MCNIKPAVALREGPLPASGHLRGPSLRVCCPGISAAPRRRDGLADRDRASSSLVVVDRTGWNIPGIKSDVAPRHLDLASLGNRVPRRWVRCSPTLSCLGQAVAGGTASAGPRPPQVARKR